MTCGILVPPVRGGTHGPCSEVWSLKPLGHQRSPKGWVFNFLSLPACHTLSWGELCRKFSSKELLSWLLHPLSSLQCSPPCDHSLLWPQLLQGCFWRGRQTGPQLSPAGAGAAAPTAHAVHQRGQAMPLAPAPSACSPTTNLSPRGPPPPAPPGQQEQTRLLDTRRGFQRGTRASGLSIESQCHTEGKGGRDGPRTVTHRWLPLLISSWAKVTYSPRRAHPSPVGEGSSQCF